MIDKPGHPSAVMAMHAIGKMINENNKRSDTNELEKMTLEQAAEADRAAAGGQPLNPATYEWLKRADRDLGLFGDPE